MASCAVCNLSIVSQSMSSPQNIAGENCFRFPAYFVLVANLAYFGYSAISSALLSKNSPIVR